jgi:hypothetical protein
METYATRELHALPSYLESMRACIEEMWQKAKSANKWKLVKNQAPIWTACVKDRIEKYDEATQKYTHFEENLRAQQNMRAKRLVKILSESNDERLMELATSNGIFNRICLKTLIRHAAEETTGKYESLATWPKSAKWDNCPKNAVSQ